MSNRSPKLSPELVLQGYAMGAFPMSAPDGAIHWFSPDPRCIFTYETFKISRSLRQAVRRGTFELRVNTRFDEVLAACRERPEGTWISGEIQRVYGELHRLGFAHSVEAWQGGRLVGGLYGVALGGAFFGESMFHRATNASKVALVALIERLKRRGFTLIDTQWATAHLRQFGVIEIPRDEYLRRLAAALRLNVRFADGREE